jgi:lysozyme
MNKNLVLSAIGLIAIAGYEAFVGPAYKDVAGIWTNGFGNTVNVDPSKSVTVPQALEQLGRNTKDAETAINTCFKSEMSQQTFDALTSWAFNVGGGAACKSTAAKKWNAGDKAGSCRELLRWDKVGGKPVKGLTIRRQKESRACLEGLS